jgi:hypothetical protein
VTILSKIIAMPRNLPGVPDLAGAEYFKFEEDFVEENVRCIPMIVRFKMDAAGIKLKLAEWCKFNVEEKKELAIRSCATQKEIKSYYDFLKELIKTNTGNEATEMPIDNNPLWANKYRLPDELQARLKEEHLTIHLADWGRLNHLQRFALLKLCRPGHESRNFIKAVREFGLVD